MTKKIGIIGAMNEEIELFLDGMSNVTQYKKAGIIFYEGSMNNKSAILCKSGVGKINAAVCTQILIDDFNIKQVIFTGVAGALHPELQIGDIVVSTAAMQHDIDASALGFNRETIPFADKSTFEADNELIRLALKASEDINEGRVVTGLILSGDQFISAGQAAKELHQLFGGYCTEMEGAAVAQVCHMNEIPFVIVRSMSDKADGSAHINFPEFTKLASGRSYLIVDKMLKMLD